MVQDEKEQEDPDADTYFIKVVWRLNDIDYPNCLDYFVLDYYDTLYNETGFSRTFTRPFQRSKFELEVANNVVPCEQDYEFIIRAFGLNGRYNISLNKLRVCYISFCLLNLCSTLISRTSKFSTRYFRTTLLQCFKYMLMAVYFNIIVCSHWFTEKILSTLGNRHCNYKFPFLVVVFPYSML